MTGIMEYLFFYFKGKARTPRHKFFPVFIIVWICIILATVFLYKYSCNYFDNYADYMQQYWPTGFYENEVTEVQQSMEEVAPELVKQGNIFKIMCLSYIYWIVVNIFPMLNLIKRRLHDVGKSAWWILTPLWLIFIFCDSELWDNKWGVAVESEEDEEDDEDEEFEF